jgi:hypothetical protein
MIPPSKYELEARWRLEPRWLVVFGPLPSWKHLEVSGNSGSLFPALDSQTSEQTPDFAGLPFGTVPYRSALRMPLSDGR